MVVVAIYFACHLAYIIYYAFDLYQLNPFIRPKPLSENDRRLIRNYFPVYEKLPPTLQSKCDRRISWFRIHKKFVFYGDVAKKADLRLVISAALVLMTLGLRHYKMTRSLLRIIVYPSQFYSRINRRHHLGEYNPKFKMVIFAADMIWEGFDIPDDNRNLALHELAHALSFEMLKRGSWEAKKFRVGLRKIKALFSNDDFVQKMDATHYFREYGRTNLQESFSVLVENFAETPVLFKKDFPELFEIVRQMLNFDFLVGHGGSPIKTES